ncbi:MAG TPA: SpoIIE family protein phosphatase [Pseudonocardia sp.]|nr:SpoIIE family protein phosphatase [Pseudonocardia sp.]
MPLDETPGPAGTPSDVLECFESVPAILWAFEGPELRVVAANAGARASAGNRAGIVGRPIRQVLPELDGQQIFEMMEEAYAAGRPVSAADRRVLVDRDGDGRLEEGFFTYTFLPTFRPDGAVRGLVVHIVETTAQAVRAAEAERSAAVSEQRFRQASEVVLELQRSLLPGGVPVLPQIDVAAQYRVGGDELAAGGDWFDAVVLADGRVALVVGDVVGHGARAAGAMGQLRAVLLEALSTAGGDPAAALRRLDRFAGLRAATRAATVCVAVADPATGAVAVGAHGHPPPLLVGADGDVRRVHLPATAPLGTGGAPAAWVDTELAAGDALLLYTDGLIERPGRAISETLAELAATLAAARRDTSDGILDTGTSLPASPVERLATVVVERMAFLGDGYRDDVTVLVAQRRPPVAPFSAEVEATAASVGALRRALTSWLVAAGAGTDDVDALAYAAGEAVTNSVQHAYADLSGGAARPVTLRGRLDGNGSARLEVADAGRWRSPPSRRAPGGRGMLMMHELCDAVDVDRGPAGTTVRLTRRLERPVTVGTPQAVPRRPQDRADALTIEVDEGAAVVTVSGPVDLATVARLRSALLHAARGGVRALCVDLSGITVLSSAGVQLLLDLAAVVPDLTVAVPPGGIAHDVLRLAGLHQLLAVVPRTA